MSTPSIQTLRAQAQELLKLVGDSPVQQILAISLAQANNGTTPDPDLTTNEYLDLIRTWQHQPASDVNAIIVNQVMRYLANPAGGTTQIFAGAPNPNGYQSATGPAIYLQSDVSPPTEWFKVTTGTSNNEWVSSGGSGGFVSIYSGATVTPQAATWTILDGRVNQVGLDVEATTGTTSITTGTSLTFDGTFNLNPIGATLATFSSAACFFGNFSPGTLANLSTLAFSDCTFTSIDVTGCQNQLAFSASGCVCPTLTTQNSPGLYSFYAFGGTFGNLNFSGCPELTSVAILTNVGLSYTNALTGTVTITNLASITSATFAGSLFAGLTGTYGAISITGCTSLVTVNLSQATLTSVDLSGCTSLTNLYLDATGNYSLNLTGCTSLITFDLGFNYCDIVSLNLTGCSVITGIETSLGTSALQTVTLTTVPLLEYCRFPGAALNVASVNAILQALDANGISNGTLDLSGGTSAAPTGAGVTAKTSLQGKGWTVTTN